MPRIINGEFDPYLRRYARGINQTGLPLIIRFDHEMNGNWYPWSEVDAEGRSINGNHKGDYVKMWRHVHDIFEAEGANRFVVWLWAPNRVNRIPNMPLPVNFYPGDRYVDMIGMSGYYRPYPEPATFDETYNRTLPALRATTRNKPILLAEIGASEDRDEKVGWIVDLFENLVKPENSDIAGFVWFNFSITSKVNGTANTNDWRINSTPASTRAFARGVSEARFGQPTNH